MEGKIDLSARRQVTNKLRDAYGKASKTDKARILDEVQAATGVARSTARRLLSGGASRIRRSRSTGGGCGLARMGTRRVSSWLTCGS